jgi:hypothetical protein
MIYYPTSESKYFAYLTFNYFKFSDDPDAIQFRDFGKITIPAVPRSYGQLNWFEKNEIPPNKVNHDEAFECAPEDIENKIPNILDENAAKSLFIDYVNRECCYGKVPAIECEIFKTVTYKALYVRIYF